MCGLGRSTFPPGSCFPQEVCAYVCSFGMDFGASVVFCVFRLSWSFVGCFEWERACGVYGMSLSAFSLFVGLLAVVSCCALGRMSVEVCVVCEKYGGCQGLCMHECVVCGVFLGVRGCVVCGCLGVFVGKVTKVVCLVCVFQEVP